MTGGVLVVVDRLGRPSRRFPLTQGLATIGRDPDNDIRIVHSEVAAHHATVLIHDAQAVIRSTGGGVTLVNGHAVTVAPLRHGDEISVGGRALRWEYSRPPTASPRHTSPVGNVLAVGRRARGGRERRRSVPDIGNPRERAVQLALEMAHRVSMPGSSGGKQVAIVQPQRRDISDYTERTPARASPLTTRRSYYVPTVPSTSLESEDNTKRKSSARTSPKDLQNTTKATLWIESRKTSPRRKVQTPSQLPPPRRSMPNKKKTPLRLTVLKKAQSAHKAGRVVKIEAPLTVDHTKQAAIMLMTGHTPKSKLSIANKSNKRSPSYLVKKPSPVRKTPRGNSGRSSRGSKSTGSGIGVTPSRGSDFAASRRSSKRHNSDRTVSILEISDSTQDSTARTSSTSRKSPQEKSPSLPSPKKSALKDQSKKSMRKTESIKFDLSNLENHKENDGMDTTRYESDGSEDITLRYSESSTHSPTPSPRRSIHSRSSRMLEQMGSPMSSLGSPYKTMTPESPSSRRSLRGNAIVQKVLEASVVSDSARSDLTVKTIASDRTRSDLSATVSPDRTKSRLSANSKVSDRTRSDLSAASDRTRSRLSANTDPDRTRSDISATLASERTKSRLSANTIASDRTKSRVSANATVASAFRTRTLSPRHNLESYSVVDLVSFDSEDATKSVYDSADSTNTTVFGTPAGSRKTRSTIEPVLLGSSTPYAGRTRATRSKSSSNATQKERVSVVSTRRSKSLTTPENGQPVVVTRPPRASRSRSRIHDDLSLLDATEPDDSSPRTSKRSRTNVSETIDISTVDLGDKTDVGMTTPENRRSPEAEGTPVLSIRSLLDSSQGSFVSIAKARDERDKSSGQARRSRLRLSQEPAGSEDEGTITPTSVVKPSPESVKNKHSTAKKPQSKRSIIDDLNRSDIVKQLFDSPVKRKLTQSMSEFSRKRLFEDDGDETLVNRTTRRTLANGASAPSLLKGSGKKAGKGKGKKQSPKNDLTDVRGVKAVFGKQPEDDLRRVTGIGRVLRKTSPKNDLTDVRGVRKMFQRKSPTNDLRNVSGVKRILRGSPKNDLTDVRGVRGLFKGKKHKTSYQDVSGIEELFQSRDRSTDAEELFDELVGRPKIKAVYSRTFDGRVEKQRKPRRRSLRVNLSIDQNNVEEWLEKELKRHLPASRRVTMEMKKLATDTVEGSKPILESRTRNSLSKPTSIHGKSSPSEQFPVPISPARIRQPAQRAVHSTPLKGGLQITMNASELGRVSPIAGPSREHIDEDVSSMSTQRVEETAVPRSPQKLKSPKKNENKKAKSPEKLTKRVTRNRKSTEPSVANTKRRRSSLVVSKKAPVMSPKTDKALIALQNQLPEAGPSRTRARAVKAAVVVAKPSPKLKPLSRAKTAAPTEIKAVELPKTRNLRHKKPESSKVSPKGKKIAPTNASKVLSQTKARKAGVQRVVPPEEPSQPKRARRGAAESLIIEKLPTTRGRKAHNQTDVQPEPEKKLPNSRGRKAQSQTTVEPKNDEIRPIRGRKTHNLAVAELVAETKTKARGRRAQNQISVEPEPEEKGPNIRGRRVPNQKKAEPVIQDNETNTRGGKAQSQTIVQSIRTRKTQNPTTAQPSIEEERPTIRGRRTRNHNSESKPEAKQPTSRARKAQNQTVPQLVIEEKSIRGKKQTKASVQSETDINNSNTRAKKVQFDVNLQYISPRRGKKTKQDIEPKSRGHTAQSSTEQPQPPTRGRKAKPDVTITETKGKRKAAEVDLLSAIPPKRGKTTKTPAKKELANQKATLIKDAKAEDSKKDSASSRKKQETSKSVRSTKSKIIEEPVKMETRRGRKATEPQEPKTVELTRGKRKAIVDPSPAKYWLWRYLWCLPLWTVHPNPFITPSVGAKKVAKMSTTPVPSSVRPRRAARRPPLAEVTTKAARGRRR